MDFWQEYTIKGTDFHSQLKKTVKVTARSKNEAEIIAHFKGLIPPYEFILNFLEFGEDAEIFVDYLEKSNSEPEKIEVHTVAKFSEVEMFIHYLNDPNFQPEKIKVRVSNYENRLEIIFNDGEKASLLIKALSTTLKNISIATDINGFIKIHNMKINDVRISEPDADEYEIDFVLEEINEV